MKEAMTFGQKLKEASTLPQEVPIQHKIDGFLN